MTLKNWQIVLPCQSYSKGYLSSHDRWLMTHDSLMNLGRLVTTYENKAIDQSSYVPLRIPWTVQHLCLPLPRTCFSFRASSKWSGLSKCFCSKVYWLTDSGFTVRDSWSMGLSHDSWFMIHDREICLLRSPSPCDSWHFTSRTKMFNLQNNARERKLGSEIKRVHGTVKKINSKYLLHINDEPCIVTLLSRQQRKTQTKKMAINK